MKKRWMMYAASKEEPTRQIVPENDDRPHDETGTTCWCNPDVEYKNEETGIPYDYPLVIHNAMDMRELIEQAEEIKDDGPEWPDVMGGGSWTPKG